MCSKPNSIPSQLSLICNMCLFFINCPRLSIYFDTAYMKICSNSNYDLGLNSSQANMLTVFKV